jgi:hypothetical protein
MKKTTLFLLTLLVSSYLFAQNTEDVQVKTTLRDGSIYNGTVKVKNIMLETDYGKLNIPFKNVSYIDVGLTPDKTNEAKIIALAKQLSNETEETRRIAYEKLTKTVKITEIAVLKNYLYSDAYKPSELTGFTLDELIQELQNNFGLTDAFPDKDVISIDNEYTMGGLYTFKDISIKTEFGTLSIPKEKIQKIEVMYVASGDSSSKGYVLAASKHISGNTNGGWLKTGIMVKKGQRLVINASGEVVLQSLSGQKYNPDNQVGANYNYEGDYGYNNTYPTFGNLVYKIGENGTMYKGGAKFNQVINETGMLYLSIYETVYNASNTGSYTVKVKVQ